MQVSRYLRLKSDWLSNRRLARRGMAFGLAAAALAALAVWGSVAVLAADAPAKPAATKPAAPATKAPVEPNVPKPPVPGTAKPPATTATVPAPAPDLNITGAWTRATPGDAKTAAIYLTVVNTGGVADQLTGVETQAAEKASLHMMEMSGNMAQMKEAVSVPVPATGQVALAPNGRHIMLEGLKAPLKEGESFFITLIFAKAGRQDTTVTVLSTASMGPDSRTSIGDKLLNATVTPLPSAADKK